MSLKRKEKTYNGLQNFKHLFDNLKSRTFVMMMYNNVKTYSLGKIMNNCSIVQFEFSKHTIYESCSIIHHRHILSNSPSLWKHFKNLYNSFYNNFFYIICLSKTIKSKTLKPKNMTS